MARLHAMRLDLPAHDMELEARDLRAAAETAAAIGADPGDLAERLIPRLADVEPAVATIHGSFHDDQVLVGEHGVTLLDLDSASIGHPLFDVGEFASYLTAAGRTRPVGASSRPAARGATRCCSRRPRCCAGAASRSATSSRTGSSRSAGGSSSRASGSPTTGARPAR